MEQTHDHQRQPKVALVFVVALLLVSLNMPPGCALEPSEGSGPWLDIVVPLRNRLSRLRRLVLNIGMLRADGSDRRLRVVVADQGTAGTDFRGLLAGLAEQTCVQVLYINATGSCAGGGFSRLRSLRAGIAEVNRRWPGDMVLTLDVDTLILATATFVGEARRHIERNVSYWSPAAFETLPRRPAIEDPLNGDWQSEGPWAIGVFASDAVRLGLFAGPSCPAVDDDGDDGAAEALVRAGLMVHRHNVSGYFHLWHPKVAWQLSADGVSRSLPRPCLAARESSGRWVNFVVPHHSNVGRLTSLLLNLGDMWGLSEDRRMRVLVGNWDLTGNVTEVVAALSRSTCVPMTVINMAGDSECVDEQGQSMAALLNAARPLLAHGNLDDVVFTVGTNFVLP
eukprot:m51a1_g520 hypothetical protein (395) ;mRNA; f:332306-333780